jgi:hypothetical protein
LSVIVFKGFYVMNLVRRLLITMVIAVLTACGGASGDDAALVTQLNTPGTGSTMLLKLTDASGTVITNNTVGLNSTAYIAQGQLRDSAGVALPNQLVTFTTDPAYGSFVNGTTTVVAASPTGTVTVSRINSLTDAKGIVKVQLVGTALGAANLIATSKVNTVQLTTTLPYQVSSLAAAIPTSIVFSAATPAQIVISTATAGARQSTVKFKVINQTGVGVPSQSVKLNLDSQSLKAGVTFITATGSSSTASQTVISDIDGIAQIVVSSGSLPTGVVVNAALVSNPAVIASSAGLSVSSGRLSQKTMSISATNTVVEAFNLDGVSNELTVIATDRLGNPIPQGTVVSFVTSHGLIGTFVTGTTTSILTNSTTGTATEVVTSIITDSKGSCTLSATSSCKVKLISSGVRPANGRVTVLAYADGEETFIDLNGNNQWEPGEPFTDLGQAYLDTNANFVYDFGVDQAIPGGNAGASACIGTDIGIANTCDGTWSNFIRVRQRFEVIWATSQAKITQVSRNTSAFNMTVTDLNGNPMAAGTTVEAELIATATSTGTCKILSQPAPDSDSKVVGNYGMLLNGDAGCATMTIKITVTSKPSGIQTSKFFS